jgi:hypothetical protein
MIENAINVFNHSMTPMTHDSIKLYLAAALFFFSAAARFCNPLAQRSKVG